MTPFQQILVICFAHGFLVALSSVIAVLLLATHHKLLALIAAILAAIFLSTFWVEMYNSVEVSRRVISHLQHDDQAPTICLSNDVCWRRH